MLSSKRGNSLLVSAMAAALVLFVSGCQKYEQQEVRVADGGPGGVTPAQKVKEKYTPELQKYFVDVTTLPAYKAGLTPLLNKLNVNAWTAAVQVKKWLFVPQELNANDRSNMAIHFLENEDETLAIQTNDDVRVQAALFKSLSVKDQSEFLLTEVLTSVYLLKNLSDAELCTLLRESYKVADCTFNNVAAGEEPQIPAVDPEQQNLEEPKQEASEEIITEDAVTKLKPRTPTKPVVTAPPVVVTPKNPLTATDYHKIGLLSTYLKETKDITQKKMLKRMTDLGMDIRIFKVEIQAK